VLPDQPGLRPDVLDIKMPIQPRLHAPPDRLGNGVAVRQREHHQPDGKATIEMRRSGRIDSHQNLGGEGRFANLLIEMRTWRKP
jgi:hypothetical protein